MNEPTVFVGLDATPLLAKWLSANIADRINSGALTTCGHKADVYSMRSFHSTLLECHECADIRHGGANCDEQCAICGNRLVERILPVFLFAGSGTVVVTLDLCHRCYTAQVGGAK